MDEQEQSPDNPVSTQDTSTEALTPQEPTQQPTEVTQEQTTTQPLPESPQPPAPVPPKSGNPLTLILIILILALLGVGGYFLFQNTQLKSLLSQPTPTPVITETPVSPTPYLNREPNGSDKTADWEMFTNKEYGFSIKYPKTWTKEEGTHVFKEEDLFSVVIVGKTQKQDTEFYDGARVTIGIPIKTDKEITNWVNEYYPSKNIDDEPNIFSEEIINSLRFHKVYTCGLGCFTYYNIKHNGHVYRIMVFAEGPKKDQHQKTLDQILSTFRFLE